MVGCWAYGWWWLGGLEEVRRWENEPVHCRALGNILPDIEGHSGAAEAFLWPALVAAAIGGSALVEWASTRRTREGQSIVVPAARREP